MLIRLSELRALIGEVLTEAEKKKEKSNWVPPWLNKSKDDKRAKNEAADAGKKEDAKPAAKKEEPKAPEKKAAAPAKKEKSSSTGKAMPVGHELNKGKGKASGGGDSGKKKSAAAPTKADKKAPAKSEKAPSKDVAPKFKGKPSPRAEFGAGTGNEFPDADEDLGGDDISAGVGDVAELEAPQSLEDVPTNVVGMRVWLRDFVAPQVPESQMSAFHRLVTAFVSQAKERQLAQKEPEMRKRLGMNGDGMGSGGGSRRLGGAGARPSKMGQPSRPVVAGPGSLSEKKR